MLALRLALVGWQTTGEPLPPGDGGFLWALFQTLVMLGIVCAVAYVTLRVLLPKLGGLGWHRTGGLIHIVDALPLDPRRTLYVIEIKGKYLLVGASEAGLQVMETLDAAVVEQALAAARESTPQPVSEVFARRFLRK